MLRRICSAKTRHKSSSFRLAALHHLCNEADITATALITRELTGSGRSPQDPEKSVEVLIWLEVPRALQEDAALSRGPFRKSTSFERR